MPKSSPHIDTDTAIAQPAAVASTEEPDWYEEFTVEPMYEGWRLDRFLASKLRRATRSQVRRILRQGPGASDGSGRLLRAAYRMRRGDVIRLPRFEKPSDAESLWERVMVLQRGADWLAIDKPAGLLVHRTAHEARFTVESWLQEYEGDARWEPVHRLDRETSGVLLCARGLAAIRAWRGAFAEGRVEKTYLAWLTDPEGRWPAGCERNFDQPLGRLEDGSLVKNRVGMGDWPCRTRVRALRRDQHCALVRVQIEQGRQHQIRAHLSLFGTPVRGDKLYEAGDAFFLEWLDAAECDRTALLAGLPSPFHCLHAARLVLPSGDRGEALAIEAPTPAHFGLAGAVLRELV